MTQKTQVLMMNNPRKYPKDSKKKKVVTEDAFGFVDDSDDEDSVANGQEEEMKESPL